MSIMSRPLVQTFAGLAILVACATAAVGQQVTVGTPFNRVSDSFFENTGVSFGLRFPGGFFNMNNPAAPPFGGFDPAAGANFGFGVVGDNGSGFFNFTAGQGSRRSVVSQTPSVTIMNGGSGFVSDTTQRPFVISVVPVVGDEPEGGGALANSPLAARLARMQGEGGRPAESLLTPRSVELDRPLQIGGGQGDADGATERWSSGDRSSAAAPPSSVAAIRRAKLAQRAAEQAEAEAIFARGRRAEAAGKPGVARVYYRQAARLAAGELRDAIEARARGLDGDDSRDSGRSDLP